MGISWLGRQAAAIRFGDNDVSEVYVGDRKVWPTRPDPVEITEPIVLTEDGWLPCALTVTSDGTLVLVVDPITGRVKVFHVPSASFVTEFTLPEPDGSSDPGLGHGWLFAVSSASTPFCYFASLNGLVVSVNTDTFTRRVLLSPDAGYQVYALCADPNGGRVFIGTSDGLVVYTEDDKRQKPGGRVDIPDEFAGQLIVSVFSEPDRRYTYVGTTDKLYRLLDDLTVDAVKDLQSQVLSPSIALDNGSDLFRFGSGGDQFQGFNVAVTFTFEGALTGVVKVPGSPYTVSQFAEILGKPLVAVPGDDSIITVDTALGKVAHTIPVEADFTPVAENFPLLRGLAVHPGGELVFATFTEAGVFAAIPIPELEVEPPVPPPPPPVGEKVETVTVTATGTTSVPVPDWATKVDVVAVGGGGGGGQSAFLFAGKGGGAASWAAQRFSNPSGNITVRVGNGGRGADGANVGGLGFVELSAPGEDSTVTVNGQTLVAKGGPGGFEAPDGQWGKSPGSYEFEGLTYYGGVTAKQGSAPGGIPGAGGAGSDGVLLGIGKPGGRGANGRVWLQFRGKQQ